MSGRDLLGLFVAAGVLFTVGLGARDLWNPNEPLYGRAVVEMADRGDWLVPTVNDKTFDEKPILYFWLALAASELFGGINELTLRLPSAISGALAVALLYLLVRPYAGRRRARLAAALLATTYIVFWSAHSVQMDLLLTTCSLGAILAATRVLDHRLSPVVGWTLAGVAAGLGFMAKGPVGLICPGLVFLLYTLFTRRAARLVQPALLGGAFGFLVVASPWYLLLWLRGETSILVELLYRQNIQRFVDPWDHQAPWWYYLKNFWIDMLPWALFLPLAWGLSPDKDEESRLHRLAWIWIFALVGFFSLSASKRSPYILPVAPAVAILVSALAERWLSGRLDRRRRQGVLVIHALLAVALLAAAVLLATRETDLFRLHPSLVSTGRLTLTVLAAGGTAVLAGLLVSRWRSSAPAVALFVFVLTLYLVAATRVLPALDVVKSHRPLCEEINSHLPHGQALLGYRLWEWRASYSYYSGRSVRNLESAEELRRLWESGEPVFVIVERGMLGEARGVLGRREPLVARGVGSNFIYLFGNRWDDAQDGPIE